MTFQLIGSSGTAAVHSAPETVERVSAARLPTEVGEFRIAGYRSKTSDEEFVALYKGEIRADVLTLARIHSQCLTGDVFGSTKCDCGAARPVEIVGRGRPSGA